MAGVAFLKCSKFTVAVLLFIHYFQRWNLCESLWFVEVVQLVLWALHWHSLIQQLFPGSLLCESWVQWGRRLGREFTFTELCACKPCDLEWVAVPSSRGSFQPRGQTHKLLYLPKKYKSLYSKVSVWQTGLFFQASCSCPSAVLHGEGSWGRAQAWWESMVRSMNNDCCVRGGSGDTNAM